MTNLERSEVAISRILAILIDRGFQADSLHFEEAELDRVYYDFFVPCFDWLENEGLVRSKSILRTLDGGGTIFQPAITSLGLKLLGQTIVVEGESIVLGKAVQRVSDTNRSLSGVGDFVGGILGGFTKSIGS